MKLFFTLILLFSCSPKYLVKEGNAVKGQYISMKISNLYLEENNYHADLEIQNLSEFPILLFSHDLNCHREGAEGKLVLNNLKSRIIPIDRKSPSHLKMVCLFEEEQTAQNFEIRLEKVYENNNSDGRTIGQSHSQELIWKKTIEPDIGNN